ncbi:MAG: AAA family ATPase [Chloroflexota bacterium]
MRQFQMSFHTPLINRTREWAIMEEAFERLAGDRGGIVFLTGDAGMGKSRLIFESISRLYPQLKKESQFKEEAAFAYETSLPYGLITRLLRQLLELGLGAGPETIRERMRTAGFNEAEEKQATRVLESLFGITGGNQPVRLSGEEFVRQLLTCMEHILSMKAGKHPVILILDDLQWIDDSSADLLARLLHLVEHKAILLLCAVRRDRHTAGWRLKEAAERNLPHRLVEIALYPLTDTDSRQLLDGLLGESEFPAELRSLILDKAEGNPLFVEEVVHHLIEHGYLVREGKGLPWKTTGLVDSIQLPDSLQALLTARIDRLDEATRRTVQIAAVIGRFFPRSPLAALVEQPELLDQQLLELQRMELIRETTRVPEPGYTFYHALTHEATYNTILLKQRRIMHRQVAETIETLREDNLSVVAPVLAHHFAEGDAPERALPYLIMAADSALQLHATAEAIAFYNRALPMAIDFDEPPERVTHIYLSRGRALELQSRFKDADQTYQELEQRGLDCDDQGMVLQSIIAQGKLRSNVTPFFDADDARELMDRALKLAQELGDRPAEVRILWNMVNIDRFDLNSIHNAIERGERALEMARELGLIEEEAYLLNDLTDVFGTVGRIEEAKQLAKKAHERWRALGNEPMLADSLSNACMIAFMSGEMDRALALADEAYRITSRIDNPWGQGFSQGLRGVVYIYLGQLGRAMEDLPAALIKSIEANFMGGQVVIHSSLAHLYQEVGLMQLAKEHAEKGIRIGREFIPQFVGLSLARLILIKLALGQVDAAAEIWADNAELAESRNNIIANDIVVAQIELALAMGEHERLQDILQTTETNFIQNGIWGFLPDIWQGYAKVLLVKGEVDEARDKITEAIALARKIGLRLNLWHYLLTKLEIEQRVDNQEGVIALKSEIREEIEYIAGNIFEDDMRRNFLAQPSIQELVQKDLLIP